MAALRKVGLADVIAGLPEVAKAPVRVAQVDLLVAVLGFEERAVSAVEQLQVAGGRAQRAMYLRYATNATDNQANEPRMQQALGAVADRVESLDAEASGLTEELAALLPAGDEAPRVLVDLSVASNRLVLRMLKALLDRDIDLSLLYSEAAEYFPTRDEIAAATEADDGPPAANAGALSEGIGHVDVGIEHPGQHLDALPHLVLLFPGFSAERSRAALSAVDPALLTGAADAVVWFIGRPHLDADAWRQEALERLHRLAPGSRRLLVSTFDYRQTLQELDRVYLEHEGRCRTTLVPMGSKLQAVGASLFCYLRPDVSALFATPSSYNASRYSRGCKDVWRLDLGPTAALRAALDRVGLLEFAD